MKFVDDPLAWSPRKLGIGIAIAIASQLLFILWFSARGEFKTRVADSRPAIQLFDGVRSEWLRLTDPTLFARAHPDGISAAAWLDVPKHAYQPTDKGDAPAWLPLAPESLGATFQQFVRGYSVEGSAPRSWQPPTVTPLTRVRIPPVPESRVSLQGPLASRGIVSAPLLPTWTNTDVLAPSRVQVMVDPWGNPISAALLTSSGLRAADEAAVALARQMMFGSETPNQLNHLQLPETDTSRGLLIFSWRTLSPITNNSTNPR